MAEWTLLLTVPVVALAGYLLGSVPFGLVLCRMAGLGDIRAIGSGNIGATNVLRTGRKDLALLTLVLDSGKGAMAAVLLRALLGWSEADPLLPLVAGVAAVIGHNYPVWLGFRGGKGGGDDARRAAGDGLAGGRAGLPDLAGDGGGVPLFLAGRAGRVEPGARAGPDSRAGQPRPRRRIRRAERAGMVAPPRQRRPPDCRHGKPHRRAERRKKRLKTARRRPPEPTRPRQNDRMVMRRQSP